VPPAGTETPLPAGGNWQTGNLTTTTQADWYKFTAVASGTYYIQWDDAYEGSDSYSGDLIVSAYRTGGPGFFNRDSGYKNPPSLSLNAGETVYVLVVPYEPQTWALGNYRIKYYQ
jgi:hypothetical protein